MMDLEPFFKRVKEGYEGDTNEDGKKHGKVKTHLPLEIFTRVTGKMMRSTGRAS